MLRWGGGLLRCLNYGGLMDGGVLARPFLLGRGHGQILGGRLGRLVGMRRLPRNYITNEMTGLCKTSEMGNLNVEEG